ncbi:MAG: hypothetical protein KIT22_06860 [Verrucomicrobiae bacterium]|nr:hypothetical protein [Verrucomicrobiae bacterium]
MNSPLRSLVLAALGAGTLTLAAQTASDGSPDRPQRGAPPLVAALDANQDGVLDATEIAKAATALATLDTNADGQISREELRPQSRGGRPGGSGGPAPEGQGGPGGPRRSGGGGPGFGFGGGPLADVLDANQDGTLDATEIANAPTALATLDANSDGQLTREELQPQRPEGGPARGGKRGPRAQRPDSDSAQ